MNKTKYTYNQTCAIKRIQALSYNDEEFRRKLGLRDLTFQGVIDEGYWSLDELEDMGAKINEKFETLNFYEDRRGRERRRYAAKIPNKQQLSYQARSLNKRDKPIRRVDKKFNNENHSR